MIGLVSTPGIRINVLAREHKVILARTQSMRLGRGLNAAAAKRKKLPESTNLMDGPTDGPFDGPMDQNGGL